MRVMNKGQANKKKVQAAWGDFSLKEFQLTFGLYPFNFC